MVMDYLPFNQLVRLRAVCRRWRDLALHPSLWKEKRVSVSAGHVLTALRSLPDVEWLKVEDVPPPAVLDNIGPDDCPNLKVLNAQNLGCYDGEGCRVASLRRLLRCRPQLHILVEGGVRVYDDDPVGCVEPHRSITPGPGDWILFYPLYVAFGHQKTCKWCQDFLRKHSYLVIVPIRTGTRKTY